MSDWELLGLFYELCGIGWNVLERVATFTNANAAIQFKGVALDWQVRYVKVD